MNSVFSPVSSKQQQQKKKKLMKKKTFLAQVQRV
jgi:hypothetical protein